MVIDRRVALIVGAGIVAGANVGKLPVALPRLAEAFEMSLLQAGLAISMLQATSMSVGILGGMLADRFGQRRVMVTGLVLLACGGLLGAMADRAGLLLASRALESVGFMATVLPGPALLSRLVDASRMRAVMGLWAAYMPTGMTLALLATPWVIAVVGWQGLWVGVSLVALALSVLIVRTVPPDVAGSSSPGWASLVGRTAKTRGPWLLALSFGTYAGQWMGVFGFLPTVYDSAGIAPGLAGLLTALGVAVNVIGNTGAGFAMHRGVAARTLLVVTSSTMFVCGWVVFGADAPFAIRYGAVLLFSACGGMVPGTLFSLTIRFAPDRQSVSTTTGLMQQGSAIGQFLAPPAIAAVVSTAGDWSHAWVVTGALAGVNLLAAVAIGRLMR
ncbi:MAG: CynX/NimT family MFS transporter [Lautropia sp.]